MAVKQVYRADFTMDYPGKDSWRFSAAGASKVCILSPNEYVLIEKVSGGEINEDKLLKLLSNYKVDLMLLEGFYQALAHSGRVHKLVVGRGPEEVANMIDGCSEPLLGCVITSSTVASKVGLKDVRTYTFSTELDELAKDTMNLIQIHDTR
ncbi:MAG: molybdopterin-guanine dinucleotide biosynthesis protein B [Aigarchaeota archaeon]|nr:molybdopterin-guanine dinucleotide biosynthesis protein B [Candidatus Pelearchaeum maunauluense]